MSKNQLSIDFSTLSVGTGIWDRVLNVRITPIASILVMRRRPRGGGQRRCLRCKTFSRLRLLGMLALGAQGIQPSSSRPLLRCGNRGGAKRRSRYRRSITPPRRGLLRAISLASSGGRSFPSVSSSTPHQLFELARNRQPPP